MPEFSIYTKKKQPKTSIIYNTYWRFAVERQNIFLKKQQDFNYPWTDDEILNAYKFTNVYRINDRVSQYLVSNVIYLGDQNIEEVFFRILLFKIFNKVETWEILQNELEEISWKNYSFSQYDKIFRKLLENKIPIYSAAYIMASGKSAFNYDYKHQNHLKMLEKMMFDRVPNLLLKTNNMIEGYLILKSYPSIGEFLAYQFITDINYSNLTNYSEQEFVKAGPGAKDGIKKCFTDIGDYTFDDIIHLMMERQHKEFEKLDLNFINLWGRDLQLIDIQNIFCEVDKYSRVAHPEVLGLSHRKRIKQKYSQNNKDSIVLFYPPKWNINPPNYITNE